MRPPFVTTAPSRSAVPAWKTSAPVASAASIPVIARAAVAARRVVAGGEHDGDGRARRCRRAASARGRRPRRRRARRAGRRRGAAAATASRDRRSGSCTRAPAGRPGSASAPRRASRRTGGPARASSASTGRQVRSTSSSTSSSPRPGTGANDPIPPVFGPRSPSSARLKSCADRERVRRDAVAEREDRDLGALEQLLDDERAGEPGELGEPGRRPRPASCRRRRPCRRRARRP